MKNPESPFEGTYPWDYLKPENSDRPAILESLVGPYVAGKETVFDMLCGFSPLSSFLAAKGCQVIGFDKSTEAIEYCRDSYPHGRYEVADDDRVQIPERVDILLHLGIAPGTDPWGLESRSESTTSIRAILKTLPRILVLETAIEFSGAYTTLKSFVDSLKAYRLQHETAYTFHPTAHSINPAASSACKRILSVYQREGTLRNFSSLSDDTLRSFFSELNPTAQAESIADLNLGFGFLYYAMGRILRPKLALVLGSQKGFSAISIALAMRDNANDGKLILVDAGYSDVLDGHRLGMGGVGFWKDLERVKRLLSRFHVENILEVRVMQTAEFAELYKKSNMAPVDLLLIDADHSYEGFKSDFETYSGFVRHDGVILCHDTEVEDLSPPYAFGVGKYLRNVVRRNRSYQAMSLPVWPGLGIIRKAGGVRGAPPTATPELSAFWTKVRSAYHVVPLPKRVRLRLKDFAYAVYGRLFPSSARYRNYLEVKERDSRR